MFRMRSTISFELSVTHIQPSRRPAIIRAAFSSERPGEVCAPISGGYLALPSQALAPIACLKVVPAFPASHRVGCGAAL